MDKDEFALKLKMFKPSKEAFLPYGFKEGEIEKMVRRYDCIPVDAKTYPSDVNSEVLKLLYSYDCSIVEIGILTFSKKVEEIEDYFIIGEVEADILALNKITLEVQVLDHSNLSWVIWPCASNGNYFLDALLLSVEYFSQLLNKPELAANPSFAYEYVLRCSEKAGGDKHIEFYKLLLGYFE